MIVFLFIYPPRPGTFHRIPWRVIGWLILLWCNRPRLPNWETLSQVYQLSPSNLSAVTLQAVYAIAIRRPVWSRWSLQYLGNGPDHHKRYHVFLLETKRVQFPDLWTPWAAPIWKWHPRANSHEVCLLGIKFCGSWHGMASQGCTSHAYWCQLPWMPSRHNIPGWTFVGACPLWVSTAVLSVRGGGGGVALVVWVWWAGCSARMKVDIKSFHPGVKA